MDYSKILYNKSLFNEDTEDEKVVTPEVTEDKKDSVKTEQDINNADKSEEKVEDTKEVEAEKETEKKPEAEPKVEENPNKEIEALKKEITETSLKFDGPNGHSLIGIIARCFNANPNVTLDQLKLIDQDIKTFGDLKAKITTDYTANKEDAFWTNEKIEERYENPYLAIIAYFDISLKDKGSDQINAASGKVVKILQAYIASKANKTAKAADIPEEPKETKPDADLEFITELNKQMELQDIIDWTGGFNAEGPAKDERILEFLNKVKATNNSTSIENFEKATAYIAFEAFADLVIITRGNATVEGLKDFAKKNYPATMAKDADAINIAIDNLWPLLQAQAKQDAQDDLADKEALNNPAEITKEAQSGMQAVEDLGLKDEWVSCMLAYAKFARATQLTIAKAQKNGFGNDILMSLCKGLGIVGGILRLTGNFLPYPVNAVITSAASCMVYASTTVASGKGLITELKKPGQKSIGKILALSAGTIFSGMGLARNGNALISNIKDSAFYYQSIELLNNPNKTLDGINSQMAELDKQKIECQKNGDLDGLRQIEDKQVALQDSKDLATGFANMSAQERAEYKGILEADKYNLHANVENAKKANTNIIETQSNMREIEEAERISRQLEANIGTTVDEIGKLPEKVSEADAKAFIAEHADEGTGESSWYANAIASGDPETIEKANQVRAYVNSSPEYIQAAEQRKAMLAAQAIENPVDRTAVQETVMGESIELETAGGAAQAEQLRAKEEILAAAPAATSNPVDAINTQLGDTEKAIVDGNAKMTTLQQDIANIEQGGVSAEESALLVQKKAELAATQANLQNLGKTQLDLTNQRNSLMNDGAYDNMVRGEYGLDAEYNSVPDWKGFNKTSGVAKDYATLTEVGMTKEQSIQYSSGLLQGIESGQISTSEDLRTYINNNVADPTARKQLYSTARGCFGEGAGQVRFDKDGLIRYATSDHAQIPTTDVETYTRNIAANSSRAQQALVDFGKGKTDYDNLQNVTDRIINKEKANFYANRGITPPGAEA